MATAIQLKQRGDQLRKEIATTINDSTLTGGQKTAKLAKIGADVAAHDADTKNYERAVSMRALLGSPAEVDVQQAQTAGGYRRGNPMPSPRQLDDAQLRAMYNNVSTRTPYRADVGMKSAYGVSTLPAPGLPPVMALTGLALEPTRVAALLPNTPAPGPTVEYLKWAATSGTGVQYVPEGTDKPDAGITLSTATATVEKLAAIMTVTDELARDFEAFIAMIPGELSRLLADKESDYLLNGRTTTVGGVTTVVTQGLRNATGILTYAVPTKPSGYVGSQGLDAINTGTELLRTGNSYAAADSLVLSPSTYSILMQAKDSQGRYLAGAPTEAAVGTLWGLPVAVSTMMPDGEALLFDSTKVGRVLVRDAMRVDMDASGDAFVNNTIRFRVEERIALAVERPSAICRVTGITG